MPSLTPAQERGMLAYLRTLAIHREPPAVSIDTNDATAGARNSLNMIEQSLSAGARGTHGRRGRSRRPTPTWRSSRWRRLRPKNPGLVKRMEDRYARLQGRGPHATGVATPSRSRDAIEAGHAVDRRADDVRGSGSGARSSQSFLIILREGFEAILVVGASSRS